MAKDINITRRRLNSWLVNFALVLITLFAIFSHCNDRIDFIQAAVGCYPQAAYRLSVRHAHRIV